MRCPQCNTENRDDAHFCESCGLALRDNNKENAATGEGSPISAAMPVSETVKPRAEKDEASLHTSASQVDSSHVHSEQDSASVTSSEAQDVREVHEGFSDTESHMQQQYAQQHYDQAQYAQQQYTHSPQPQQAIPPAQGQAGYAPEQVQVQPSMPGCLSLAMKDITSTPGWFKKIFMLCLIGCIPIVGFAVEGYVLNWCKDLFQGRRETMPNTILKKGAIGKGFFATLIRLALWFVFIVVPLLGVLVINAFLGAFSPKLMAGVMVILVIAISIALALFCTPYVNASIMRMVYFDNLESGFNSKRVWRVFKKGFGSSVFINFIPALIAIVAMSILLLIISLIAGLVSTPHLNFLSHIAPYGSISASALNSFPVQSTIFHLGSLTAVFYAIYAFLAMMVSSFLVILVMRAMGHWTMRYGQEWEQELHEGESEIQFKSPHIQ